MVRYCVILFSIFFVAASASAATDPAGLEFFEAKVRPVLTEHCYKCHSQQALDAKKLKGGLFLDSREGVLKGGENGPAIVVGKPQESRLIEAIKYSNPDLQMPPKDRLSDGIVADLEKWIAMGAPDPREATAPVAVPAKRTIDIEAAKKYWAFQPLSQAAPPAVSGPVKSPIDQFILAKLQAKGLALNEPAPRAVLIRRAYADLAGLPPTPAEVDAFVNDPSPDAWEHLIDKLLASDHYGERWGRHWLDIVRFAESNGYEFDGDRKGAYQFRDFVIRAFNQDMPYDQFIRWQIAGDKLLPGNYDAGAATGFLMAGPSPGQITAKTAEPLRYDQLDDMVSTLSSSMLAMTVGCCRCHDHKFDPFPQRDYYRLISCFAETDSKELKLDPKPEVYKTAEARWKAEQEPLMAAWEKFARERLPQRVIKLTRTESHDHASWHILDFDRADVTAGKSAVAKKLKKLEDGSLLLEDETRKNQTVVLVARTHLKNISSLRIEALADKLMPKNGPGTGAKGEFVLSRMDIRAAAASGKGKPVNVRFNLLHDSHAQAGEVAVNGAPGRAPQAERLNGEKVAESGPVTGRGSGEEKAEVPIEKSNFFVRSDIGSRSNFKGNVGYEFVAETTIQVHALGRSVSGTKITRSHQIDIWDTSTSQSVADIIVTPESEIDKNGFAYERLAAPVTLKKGHTYRITSGEEEGGDPFVDITALPSHMGVASVTSGAFSLGSGYPNNTFGEIEQGYGVPTFYFDTASVEPALLKPAKASRAGGNFWASEAAGKDRAAVIEFEKPVGFEGGTELTITLKFETGVAIGRPRIAISTAETPPPADAPSQPQAIAELTALMAESKNLITEKNRTEVARWMRTADPETAKVYAPVAEHLKKEPVEPFESVFGTGDKPGRPVYFLGRGEANKKNGLAPPGFLEVLMNSPEHDERWTVTPGQAPTTTPTTAPAAPAKAGPTSRPVQPRVAMADWITDADSGAGQQLARVIVNRLWLHHMGRGIVATPNDFGVQGDPPTHPELLDYLARELIVNGWHLKPIQKLIMCSSVYMQSGATPDAKVAIDPDNKLWWRHPPQRLEAEAVRDSLLAVSGALDQKMYGPGTLEEDSSRRSVYLTVKRSKPVLFMQLFDAPETMQSVGQRQVTTVATQALTLMNSPFVRKSAELLAKRVRPDDKTDLPMAIKAAYRVAFCRPATDAETMEMTDFIERQAKTYPKNGTDTAFVDFCQILLCSDEFVYVD